MDTELLRIYDPENECGDDGYPFAWHRGTEAVGFFELAPAIKNLVREQAGHRCIRCGHPYPPGIAREHPRGEWTPCDEYCTHSTPFQYRPAGEDGKWRVGMAPHSSGEHLYEFDQSGTLVQRWEAQAQWRILTVHHLNERKHDLRWWNLAALCQRCHLTIQRKVTMEVAYPWDHSDWFKPHAAAWYALRYRGEHLTHTQTMTRLDELLALGQREESIERMAL